MRYLHENINLSWLLNETFNCLNRLVRISETYSIFNLKSAQVMLFFLTHECSINPYPADINFVLKYCLLLSSAENIQMHFRLDFTMEANNVDPDQTAPLEQSDLGLYCFLYMLSTNRSKSESR